MTRIKRGVAALKRRKYALARAKGFKNRRSSNFPAAREALLHADSYAYAHRRTKKQNFKKLWTIRINAAARENGISFSKLMAGLKNQKIALNKKMLAELAVRNPEIFKKIVAEAK